MLSGAIASDLPAFFLECFSRLADPASLLLDFFKEWATSDFLLVPASDFLTEFDYDFLNDFLSPALSCDILIFEINLGVNF